MPNELVKLQPIFQDRKNFSMAFQDWWSSPFWFTRNADYLIFRNFNGIAVRRGLSTFVGKRSPPIWDWTDRISLYGVACSLLRPAAIIAAPFLEFNKQKDIKNPITAELLYFPNVITKEQVPLSKQPASFDFSNISSTGGYWVMRDPYASAWLNFGNLYYDRQRITNLILENKTYKTFDLRQSQFLDWEKYLRVIQSSRYAIATGGLHQASLSKYLEFACLGTPMLGEEIPFEFPWLKNCLFSVDTLNVTRPDLKKQLNEALLQQSRLRDNCLAIRDTLLKLYNPHTVLDLLQNQSEGRPIPPGYLRPEALS